MSMNPTRTAAGLLACFSMFALLAACGTWQSVKDTTVDATRAVFVSKVKEMNLVITSRSALNPDEHGAALPLVMRVYQLKDSKAFETATYAQIVDETTDTLKTDQLARTEVTLGPDASAKLSEPMRDEANYVGIVAFFRDQSHAEWHVLIPRSQWKKTDPVRLVVSGNRVEMQPL
jgi:type VI secretion system protein VasD